MIIKCYNCFRSMDGRETACPFCGYRIDTQEKNVRILRPGTILNQRYETGRILGMGGFGITYLAWDMQKKIRIAVKEYYPGTLVNRDVTSHEGNTVHTVSETDRRNFQAGLERYVKEGKILSRYAALLGVVSVMEFFYENNTAYMVMEFVDGISLKDLAESRGGRLSSEEVLKLMKPVMKALAKLHEDKLLHRDISPDNIMLDRNGYVKLIDFGAARYFETEEELQKSMTIVLKHGYAPKEQYTRKGEQQGAWTDVYALCAVMYRLLTGEVPVGSLERVGKDSLIPIQKIVSEVPRHVVKAIEKGLAVDHRKRFQSMEELYEALYVEKTADRHRGRFLQKGIFFKGKKQKIAMIAGGMAVISVILCCLIFLPGRVAKNTDNGYVVSLLERYDKNGILQRQEKPEYGQNGWETERTIVYPEENKRKYTESECDAEGNEIKRKVYADGELENSYEFQWDENGNLLQKIQYNAEGKIEHTYKYKYNKKNDVIEWVHYNWAGDIVDWNRYELDYDGRGNKVKSTAYNVDDEVQYVEEHTYDKKGNELKTTMYNADGSIGYWIEGEYDPYGNRIKSTYYNGDGSISYWEEYRYISVNP